MKLEKFKEKDKKKIGIILFTVTCVFLIAGVFLYKTFALFEAKDNLNMIEGQVQDLGDLYFAFYIDDVITPTMPGKDDGYSLDTSKSTCNNGATVELKKEDWSIKVNNLTQSRTKCTLYFKETVLATNYVTNLVKNGDTSLVYDNTTDNNLRYIGANPNNYVLFNNELWRIIGVMNNVSDDTGNTSPKLKIIRNEYYKKLAWDTNKFNEWSKATSQIELNTTYYNSLIEKDKIANINWKLGTADFSGITKTYYDDERKTDVNAEYATEWTGRIGLMYVSDYGFATSGGATTSRESCLAIDLLYWSELNHNDCKTNDWLYDSSNDQWTLTSNDHSNSGSLETPITVIIVSFNGSAYSEMPFGEFNVSPTLYLKPEVTIEGGSGTESAPYQLG